MFHFRNRLGKRAAKRVTNREIFEELQSLRVSIDLMIATGAQEKQHAAVPKEGEGVTEAQVKREWFGEDELT